MTTNREQIIAAAKESKIAFQSDVMLSLDELEAFYAIAFEAGRVAEREEIALSLTPYDKPNKTEVQRMADVIAVELVEAIRARGDKNE